MFNIRVDHADGWFLRRTWYVTEGALPELRSRWTTEDLVVGAAHRCRESNQPVTEPCDTEMISADA